MSKHAPRGARGRGEHSETRLMAHSDVAHLHPSLRAGRQRGGDTGAGREGFDRQMKDPCGGGKRIGDLRKQSVFFFDDLIKAECYCSLHVKKLGYSTRLASFHLDLNRVPLVDNFEGNNDVTINVGSIFMPHTRVSATLRASWRRPPTSFRCQEGGLAVKVTLSKSEELNSLHC